MARHITGSITIIFWTFSQAQKEVFHTLKQWHTLSIKIMKFEKEHLKKLEHTVPSNSLYIVWVLFIH